MPPKQLNKIFAFFPLLLFLINFGTKALYLTSEAIGLDEPFSIYHAQFDVNTIIEQLKGYNNPPLFELILHFWIKLFGISPLAVRLLPLIFASLSPVALFYFGKRFFSVRVAMFSSLLLSFSSLLIYYAHDCRVYTLFLLLAILSMHYFLAALEEKDSRLKTVFCFILFSALLIYAHYFGIFVLFFQVLCLLLFYRYRLLKFTGYYAMVLLLYLPHIYPLLTRMSHSVAKGTWLQAPEGIQSLYYMLWSFSNMPLITIACIIILTGALIKCLISKNYFNIGGKQFLLITWFLLSYFGMFFISYWVPMYISRYLVFVLPAYYILLMVSIDYLFKNERYANVISAVLVLSFVLTAGLNPDKKQVVGKSVPLIQQLKKENTLVLVCPYDILPSFAYHYNSKYFSAISDGREYHLTDSLLKAEHIYIINGADELSYMDLKPFKTVIYYGAGEAYNAPGNPVLKVLNENYVQCHQVTFNNSNGLVFFVKQ